MCAFLCFKKREKEILKYLNMEIYAAINEFVLEFIASSFLELHFICNNRKDEQFEILNFI
jgi:hypothetical protein